MVLDAAATLSTEQKCRMSLAIIVNARTSETQAKELGDSFVRMAKTFGPEEVPGMRIGGGTYDYMIGVYTPQERQLVLGFKNRNLEHITW